MKKLPRLLCGLVAAAGLLANVQAQATSFTSPPGLLTKEGSASTPHFGNYPGSSEPATTQVLESEFQDNVARLLRNVALRHDGSIMYTPSNGIGRSWTNVTMYLANGLAGAKTLNRTFSRNITGKLARVFVGRVSWPTMSRKAQLNKLAPWGGQQRQLEFRLQRTYLHTGQRPLLIQWEFLGGTLANNQNWPRQTATQYSFDSFFYSPSISSLSQRFAGHPTCGDSTFGRMGLSGLLQLHATAYGPLADEVTLRRKLRLDVASYSTTSRRERVIHALSLGATRQGVGVGARCNPLYLDLRRPTVYLSYVAVGGQDGYSGTYRITQPHLPIFEDLTVFGQTAWNDSHTRAFTLSPAVSLKMPDRPLDASPVRSMATSPNASVVSRVAPTALIPVFRWDSR